MVSGPLNHLLYEIMNKLFAGKPAKQAKIGQLLFSNLVISPTMNTGKERREGKNRKRVMGLTPWFFFGLNSLH